MGLYGGEAGADAACLTCHQTIDLFTVPLKKMRQSKASEPRGRAKGIVLSIRKEQPCAYSSRP